MKKKNKRTKEFVVKYPVDPTEWVFIVPALNTYFPKQNLVERLITKIGF